MHCCNISRLPLFFESSFNVCRTNIYTTNGRDALKHRASISHPTSRLYFSNIMHNFAGENVSAHMSTASCPPLLDLAARYFIQFIHFCYCRTARFRPSPLDPATTTLLNSHHLVELPFHVRPQQRDHQDLHMPMLVHLTSHSFPRRTHPSKGHSKCAHVRTLSLLSLVLLWYGRTARVYCRGIDPFSNTGLPRVYLFCRTCSPSSCTISSSSDSLETSCQNCPNCNAGQNICPCQQGFEIAPYSLNITFRSSGKI